MSHRIGDAGKVPLTGSERKAEAKLSSHMSRALTSSGRVEVVWCSQARCRYKRGRFAVEVSRLVEPANAQEVLSPDPD